LSELLIREGCIADQSNFLHYNFRSLNRFSRRNFCPRECFKLGWFGWRRSLRDFGLRRR
jgi:hypothetical protein